MGAWRDHCSGWRQEDEKSTPDRTGHGPSPMRGQVLADSLLMMSNRTYRIVYSTPFPNVQEECEWVGRVMKERTEISKACDIQKFFMP